MGTYTLYYSYTDINTCDDIDSLEVTVDSLPVVFAGNDTTLCNQPIPITLSGIPSGGTWSGSNVTSAGVFTPSGVGVSELIYTYTDINSCVNSDTLDITVINPTNADAGPDFAVCVDTGSIQLIGIPANGVWAWNTISTSGLYVVTVPDTLDFEYSFGSGNCLTKDTVRLIINDLPIVDAGNDTSFCVDAGMQTFTGNYPTGTWSGTAITSTGDFDPSLAGVGTHTITYSGAGCSTTIDIIVSPIPVTGPIQHN